MISALTAQQYVRIDRHREWGHRLEAPAAGERKTAPEQGRQRPRSSSRAAGRTKGKGSALLNLGWHHEAVFCSRPGNCSFPRREHLFLPEGALPAGLRPAPIHYSLFTWLPLPGFARHLFPLHSYLFRQQGNDLLACPICAPHFFFSLQEKKKRAAPGAKEKEGLGCKLRWTRAPTRWLYAMWQAYASLVQTSMPRPSLSAAAPPVRALPVTSSLFTLTSYFREAGGGGAQCAHWAEGASTRPRSAAHHFFTIPSYLFLPRSAPPALAVLRG